MKLTISNITKKYKNKFAVDGFDCELEPGIYGLVGPNGSGKTTLMRMITNILSPSNGRILFNDRDIELMGEDYRDLLGYVPQQIGFYKSFSAHRFLLYISSLKGIDKTLAEERIDSLLKQLNLSEQKYKKISTFSGGMKQRLGIAQGLLNDPKILILDEPSIKLDPRERVRLKNIITNLSKDKIILLSTHIISDIEYIAKEIIFIKEGHKLIQNTPQEILKVLKNKVWTVNISEPELITLKTQFIVSKIRRTETDLEVRIISDTIPLDSAKNTAPDLEDIYLYYFNEGAL